MFLLIAATSAATARAESRAKLDGDFTIDWQQTIFSTEQPVPVMSIGQTPIAVRPLPRDKKDKPKDPPRAALFVGDTIRSKTLIYPGKPYHLTLVSRDGKAHLFVNGFPDAEPAAAKLSGAVDSERDDIRISRGARAADEILADFKKKLPAGDVVVVAHRGVHKHAPENTRISYVQAVEAKAPIVEFDTALTKDGHIVGMHDKTVDRTTDGTGAVADMTLQQVRKLDAGSWKHPKYKGEPVPTIDDIADVVRGKAILMLDLKAEGQGKVIAQWLEKSKFPRDQLMLAPWEDAEGVALRRYVKDVPMIRLTSKVPTQTVDDAYFAKMKQIGFSGFSVNWNNLTKEFTDAARKNGMKVYVWTINANPEIAGAMLLGVDGIITDDAAVTAKTLRKLSTKG
jgi:glycerophosphoryl diester phosphodiesterase